MKPSVATIEPHLPFVDVLAEGIKARIGDDPLDLASCLVLLPTRRACRALRDAFLRKSEGRAALLPRMLPLGDLDEEELDFSTTGGELIAGADIPPAISPLKRQMLLTRLILAGKGGPGTAPPSPEHGVLLAQELGRLLDQVRTEGVSFDALEKLVVGDLAEHWQMTLEFLKILTFHWPQILQDEGCLDHAERRNRVLAAQAKAWTDTPPQTPIFIAGSTGSIPATADLLKVVAGLPQGHVILPGLDRQMDQESWDSLGETHPQFGLKHLIEHISLARGDVPNWQDETSPSDRVRLVREALRPAETTEAWRKVAAFDHRALEGVELVSCPGPREEALSIALMMRETLEGVEDGRTAALVTADRDLARRVAAELERWEVEVDDSAGSPISLSPTGVFLRLTARLVAGGFAPFDLLATFKHPLAAGGLDPAEFRARTRHLETSALRGPRPAPGLEGLQGSLKEDNPWLSDVQEMARPFVELMTGGAASFPDLLSAHMAFVEALAASNDLPGPARLWAGEAGERAANLMADLHQHGGILEPVAPGAYPALLEAFLSGSVVRPNHGVHPRLFIWGPLEARLQQADLVIIGGLNEGVWPPETTADPWMSRPMRSRFGLPLPERRIGLSAHDFSQAFCAPRVVITRSERMDGTPTVPSRWLMRLETVLKVHEQSLPEMSTWRDWAGQMDQAEVFKPSAPPAPCPPLSARPNSLSVTRVETWMRDPYAIYAERILKLRALDPIEADPGAADYGSMVHDALDDFIKTYPDQLPDDAQAKLLEIGAKHFEDVLVLPGVRAFWWPRFERVAAWFVAHEGQRRATLAGSHTEVSGEIQVGDFTVTAKADRIDRLKDGTLAVIDYKTGAPPSKKEVAAGFAPQLPLEALIAICGGFEGVGKGQVSQLLYWQLKGDEAGGKESAAGDDVATLAEQALEGVQKLVAEFAKESTPYAARPHPEMAPKYSDYLHLARVKEWAAGGEGDE